MMKNVCRAFTLYHDKIFVNISDEKMQEKLKKDFVVIGYFDWFKTSMWEMDESFSLTKLFEYNNALNKEGTRYQSFQNIFGFKKEADPSQCSDSEFWSSDDDDCLRFVIYLQMEKYNSLQSTIIMSLLAQKLNNKSFIIYSTLDKNDFIVCIKSLNYSATIEIINFLFDSLVKDRTNNIIYSYTSLMVRFDAINNSSSKLIAEKEDEEIIDSICIKTILNNYNEEHHSIKSKIDYFCRSLSNVFYGELANRQRRKKEIVGYEILGDTDCRFIARKVPLNRLLILFSNSGLLNRDNDLFRYCFISSMTSLNIDAKLTRRCRISDFSNYSNSTATLIERSRISTIEDKLIKKDILSGHLVTLLYQIYDYISFISFQTSKYEFVSLEKPFEVLIKSIETAIDKNEIIERPFEELYDYLSNMYSSIQENMRTDIRFYGLSDFSMMSYYSPTKLRSFYYSVINQISEYYKSMSEQDREISYQFLIFFSNTATTNVTQLWKTKFDEDKIMMVRISEKDFYEVKDLVFQLAHEAAHFVGNEEVRNREYRFYQYIFFLINRLRFYIKTELENEINIMEKNNIGVIIVETIRSLLKNVVSDNPLYQFIIENQNLFYAQTQRMINTMLEQNEIKKEKFFFYNDIVKMKIGDYLYNGRFIFDFFNHYYNYLLSQIKREIMIQLNNNTISVDNAKSIICHFKKLQEILPSVISKYENQLLYATYSDWSFAVNTLYETYSDLCAVLLFDLKADDFCNIILKRIDLRDETYIDDFTFIRMCLVLKAMNDLSGDYNCINRTFSDFFINIPFNWANNGIITQAYTKIMEKCKEFDNHELDLSFLYDYIRLCLEKLCININDKTRNRIKDIYHFVENDDLLGTVLFINDFVAKLGE